MKPTGDIKFKVLPRNSDKAEVPGEAAPADSSRTILYVTGFLSVAVLAFCLLAPNPKHKAAPPAPKPGSSTQSSVSSINDQVSESIHEHMLESEAKETLLKKQRQVENMQFHEDAEGIKEEQVRMPDQKELGVHLDSDDSADRVYEDLNGEPQRYADFFPGDKISERLANRQWVNEQERNERIAYVTNFIRSAYDRGYEVDIDANLVVKGVHPIGNKKVNINQILDKLAHQ